MFTAILIVHLILCIFLVGSILLQRSEGGALGIGGGPSGMMSGRSATNFMTRVTQVLGAAFFLTSIGLSLLATTVDTRPAGSVMGSDAATSNEIPTEGIDLSVPEQKSAPSSDLSAPAGGLLNLPASGAAPAGEAAPAGPLEAPPAEPAEKK